MTHPLDVGWHRTDRCYPSCPESPRTNHRFSTGANVSPEMHSTIIFVSTLKSSLLPTDVVFSLINIANQAISFRHVSHPSSLRWAHSASSLSLGVVAITTWKPNAHRCQLPWWWLYPPFRRGVIKWRRHLCSIEQNILPQLSMYTHSRFYKLQPLHAHRMTSTSLFNASSNSLS